MESFITKKYSRIAVASPEDLCFGRAPVTLACGLGLQVGVGMVYPEINFTLPTMLISDATWPSVVAQYDEIGEMIGRAARRNRLSGLMVEFELLPPMTENSSWGAEITAILKQRLKRAYEEFGLKSALRVTPTDIRDMTRPPQLRRGKEWDMLRKSFEACAAAGADILSIESVGGKEVNDEAMLYGDIPGVMFALGVLAPRDMEFIWSEFVRICSSRSVVPGGDSACGFANTAMQLSSQGMLPEVFAAVVRAASAVRSLVAYECGAQGPSKDCAYEGPVLKAITGTTISMEGKSAACAHFSPVGNVAAAMCDLWSNESVQNIRLLSGYAPEAFLELLSYDCRLFNAALAAGLEKQYQTLLINSDVRLSPQALVLSPGSTFRIASAIVRESTHYQQTISASKEAVTIIREATADNLLHLSAPERNWLDKISSELDTLPDEEKLTTAMIDAYGHLFEPASYGL